MKKSLQFLIGIVVALIAGVAGATQWFATNASAGVAPNEYQINVNGEILGVRAYSSTATSATKFTSAAAVTDHDTTGFGVDRPGTDHTALDNVGGYDILVFELPSKSLIDALQLGFVEGDSDMSVFWGGNSSLGTGYDFSTACFSGCANTLAGGYNLTGTGGLGFQQLNFSDQTIATPTDLSGFTNAGRYLVVAGALGSDFDDKFKVNMIQARKVPAPATLALLGLALVGMGALKRRSAA